MSSLAAAERKLLHGFLAAAIAIIRGIGDIVLAFRVREVQNASRA